MVNGDCFLETGLHLVTLVCDASLLASAIKTVVVRREPYIELVRRVGLGLEGGEHGAAESVLGCDKKKRGHTQQNNLIFPCICIFYIYKV